MQRRGGRLTLLIRVLRIGPPARADKGKGDFL